VWQRFRLARSFRSADSTPQPSSINHWASVRHVTAPSDAAVHLLKKPRDSLIRDDKRNIDLSRAECSALSHTAFICERTIRTNRL
jgi:hypothetical protein